MTTVTSHYGFDSWLMPMVYDSVTIWLYDYDYDDYNYNYDYNFNYYDYDYNYYSLQVNHVMSHHYPLSHHIESYHIISLSRSHHSEKKTIFMQYSLV